MPIKEGGLSPGGGKCGARYRAGGRKQQRDDGLILGKIKKRESRKGQGPSRCRLEITLFSDQPGKVPSDSVRASERSRA